MARREKAPSPATVAALAEAKLHYPLQDVQDFTDVQRGFIAPLPGPVLGADGHVVFDPAALDFVAGNEPDSVDASLWRQSQLIRQSGLFKVVDGVYHPVTLMAIV